MAPHSYPITELSYAIFLILQVCGRPMIMTMHAHVHRAGNAHLLVAQRTSTGNSAVSTKYQHILHASASIAVGVILEGRRSAYGIHMGSQEVRAICLRPGLHAGKPRSQVSQSEQCWCSRLPSLISTCIERGRCSQMSKTSAVQQHSTTYIYQLHNLLMQLEQAGGTS